MSDPSPQAQHRAHQRREALEKANRQRKVITAMRTALRTKAVDELELLKGNSEYERVIAKWPVLRVLKLMYGIREARAYEVLTWGRVAPTRQIRDLTFEKRAELARLVQDARKEIRVDL